MRRQYALAIAQGTRALLIPAEVIKAQPGGMWRVRSNRAEGEESPAMTRHRPMDQVEEHPYSGF
jgi:hypothetical protein